MIYKSYVSLTLLCSITTSVGAMTVTAPAATVQKSEQQAVLPHLLNQQLLTTIANSDLGQLGMITIVKKLLAQGADINTQDAEGNTPLMLAALNKKEDLAVFLSLNQAKTDISNKKNETFLEIVSAPIIKAIKGAQALPK